MKYKCLVLDHDDTVVNSTATVNFPSFMNVLKKLRPGFSLTLDEFLRYNFEPGFSSFCRLKPEDLVMIDDLKPGKIMADNSGIDFIGAGWAHSIPEITSYMKRECQHYCTSVTELEQYIF